MDAAGEQSRVEGYRKCGKQRTCGRWFLEVWQRKELAADFADVWQIKDLGTVASDEWPTAGERLRRAPPSVAWERVRKWLKRKGLRGS